MNFILTGANFVLPLITFAYVSRAILPDGIGKVSFASSVISYYSWIAMLGIPAYGIRECARLKNDRNALSKTVQELMAINLVSTTIAYLAIFVTIILVPKFRESASLMLIISSSILLNTLGMEWLYQALEQYTYITIRSLLFKFISLAATFILIKNDKDYITYGGLSIFSMYASYIFNFFRSKKYIDWKWIKEKNYKQHFRPILTLFASTVMISLYGNFGLVFMGFTKNDTMVGLYNAAFKIESVVLMISTAITAVIIPRISLCYQIGRKDEITHYSIKSLRLSFVLAVPLAMFIMLCPTDVLMFIAGNDYVSAAPTLSMLMICTLPLMLTNVFGNQLLIPMRQERSFTNSIIVCGIVDITFCVLLVPRFGSLGIAIGSFIAESVNAIYMAKKTDGLAKSIFLNLHPSPYLLGLLFAFGFEIFTATIFFTNIPNAVIRLFCKALTFFIPYYATIFFLKEDIMGGIFKTINSKLRYKHNESIIDEKTYKKTVAKWRNSSSRQHNHRSV